MEKAHIFFRTLPTCIPLLTDTKARRHPWSHPSVTTAWSCEPPIQSYSHNNYQDYFPKPSTTHTRRPRRAHTTESIKPNAPTKRTSKINPPPQPPPPQRPPNAAQLDLSQVAATTLIFILAILCFLILCVYCCHCTRGGGGARSARGGHRPLMLVHQDGLGYSTSERKPAASLPPELPLVLYAAGADRKEEKEEEPAGDCVVCLDEFEEDKELKVIHGCGHLFHPQCIDAWLVSHGSCPVCRCSQLFGTTVREGEGRGDVCVDAVGESGGEEEEEGGAGGIREEFGMERREREEMGGRGGEEGKEVEGRRCCCSSSRSEDGGKL